VDDLATARATRGDLGALLALIREFYAVDNHVFDLARLQAALPPLLESDDRGVVWTLGTPAEGYAVVTWGYSLESGGREALIDEIYVRRRGAGLGGRLLSFILDDCRRRGICRIFLETESHNARVRSLYRRAGFTEDDSIWMSRWLDSA